MQHYCDIAKRLGRIPVFVICHNNGFLVNNTLKQLWHLKEAQFIIVDSLSTDFETLEILKILEKSGVLVFRPGTNTGPHLFHCYWQELPDQFVITDPDLQYPETLPANLLEMLRNVLQASKTFKAGLALDLSDSKDMLEGEYVGSPSIYAFESVYWTKPVVLPSGKGVDSIVKRPCMAFDAGLDTTFALYDKRNLNGNEYYKAWRIAGADFTAKHLPWYKAFHKANPEKMKLMYPISDTISTMATFLRINSGKN